MPSLTLCEVLGIPEEDRAAYLEWIEVMGMALSPVAVVAMTEQQALEVIAAREALTSYGMTLIEQRRAEPRDDLITRLALDDECPLDDPGLALNVGDFIYTGNDTTQRSLSQMVLDLSDHPDVWDEVAADPGFAEAVVEECLRFRPIVPGPLRRTTVDVEHRDATWPAGQPLWFPLQSANQDEEVFGSDAMNFDPHRANARDHLSFGHGAHYCVGANLARAEMQESLRALTKAITCPQIAGDVVMTDQPFYGPVSLPITFERRAA